MKKIQCAVIAVVSLLCFSQLSFADLYKKSSFPTNDLLIDAFNKGNPRKLKADGVIGKFKMQEDMWEVFYFTIDEKGKRGWLSNIFLRKLDTDIWEIEFRGLDARSFLLQDKY